MELRYFFNVLKNTKSFLHTWHLKNWCFKNWFYTFIKKVLICKSVRNWAEYFCSIIYLVYKISLLIKLFLLCVKISDQCFTCIIYYLIPNIIYDLLTLPKLYSFYVQELCLKYNLWEGPSRWTKMWRSPSSPQIHQKYIYMWNNSYRTQQNWTLAEDLRLPERPETPHVPE